MSETMQSCFLVMEPIRKNLIHTSKCHLPLLYAPWIVSKQSVKFQKAINHVRFFYFYFVFWSSFLSWKLLHHLPNYCQLVADLSGGGQSSICTPNIVLNGFPCAQWKIQVCQQKLPSGIVETKTTEEGASLSPGPCLHLELIIRKPSPRQAFGCMGQKKLPWSVETESEREAMAFP